MDWLLVDFARDTPGVLRAIVVSADGLRLATSPGTDAALGDRLSAAASGLVSLARGTAHLLDTGPVTQTILEMAGGYLFVHAGVQPAQPLETQQAADLIWIREPFLTGVGWCHDFAVVHGHTPLGPDVHTHRIGIDSGCFRTGALSAVELADDRLRFHVVSDAPDPGELAFVGALSEQALADQRGGRERKPQIDEGLVGLAVLRPQHSRRFASRDQLSLHGTFAKQRMPGRPAQGFTVEPNGRISRRAAAAQHGTRRAQDGVADHG